MHSGLFSAAGGGRRATSIDVNDVLSPCGLVSTIQSQNVPPKNVLFIKDFQRFNFKRGCSEKFVQGVFTGVFTSFEHGVFGECSRGVFTGTSVHSVLSIRVHPQVHLQNSQMYNPHLFHVKPIFRQLHTHLAFHYHLRHLRHLLRPGLS